MGGEAGRKGADAAPPCPHRQLSGAPPALAVHRLVAVHSLLMGRAGLATGLAQHAALGVGAQHGERGGGPSSSQSRLAALASGGRSKSGLRRKKPAGCGRGRPSEGTVEAWLAGRGAKASRVGGGPGRAGLPHKERDDEPRKLRRHVAGYLFYVNLKRFSGGAHPRA